MTDDGTKTGKIVATVGDSRRKFKTFRIKSADVCGDDWDLKLSKIPIREDGSFSHPDDGMPYITGTFVTKTQAQGTFTYYGDSCSVSWGFTIKAVE